MRFLDTIVSILGDFPEVTIFIGMMGLVLLGLAALILRRRRQLGRRSESRSGVLLVAFSFGLLLVGLAGYVAARWPPGFQRLFATDFQNPEIVAALSTENLEPHLEALPGEWPQWRGPRRDGESKDAGLNLDWRTVPPKVVWRQPLEKGYSSVAVAGNRLFTQDKQGGNERVLCLDAEKGTLLWSHSYPVDYREFRSHATGPRATPTVHDGRVYAVGATGKFLCFEAEPSDSKGKLLWQHDLLEEFAAKLAPWGYACSPLIDGKNVIVQPGGEQGSIAAFDRVTGELVWKQLDDVSGYSSPIIATLAGSRQLLAFTGTRLVGLRPADGALLWSYDWKTSFEANVATPIVAGDCVFISSDYGKGCALLKIVSMPSGELKPEPVYVRQNKVMRNHQSTCVLHGGFLYGMDTSGTGGRVVLRCVDLRAGEEKWATDPVGKAVPLLVEGHLLLLFDDGQLVLATANPERYQEKGRMTALTDGSEVWALPALAHGRLFLRSHKEIVCVDLRK
jgi:outer membrane protein assembly factor BamB